MTYGTPAVAGPSSQIAAQYHTAAALTAPAWA